MVRIGIVGGGPVGLTLHLLLKNQGVSCSLFEQRARPSRAPAAHFINFRSMEIFASLRDLEPLLLKKMEPIENFRFYMYCRKIGGGNLLEQDNFGSGLKLFKREINRNWSSKSFYNLPQYQLAKILKQYSDDKWPDSAQFATKVVKLQQNPQNSTGKKISLLIQNQQNKQF